MLALGLRCALVMGTLLLAGCAAPPPAPPPPASPPAEPPAPPAPPPVAPPAPGSDLDLWVVDQSDTNAEGGGTLWVYNGTDLLGGNATAAQPWRFDLGGAYQQYCRALTGSAPKRPHMLMFNRDHTHAILSHVASGHVLFLDARTMHPTGCIDVGAQAHAAVPSPDQSYVAVANQNGKLLQRIATNYSANNFTLEHGATLNLTSCTTPSGAPCEAPGVRPDNAPICPVVDSSGRWVFVTLRGGGMLVVDGKANPMAIVAEYDNATIHANGCGGNEVLGKMFLTSGGGTPANPLEADLYVLPATGLPLALPAANTPPPRLVLSEDDRDADFHGTALVGDRYLWVADRHGNRIVVVDTLTEQKVGDINLTGPHSPDPAPDLLAVAPSGSHVFATLRGPAPLTGNAPAVNNSVGATPGVLVLRVDEGGRSGAVVALAPLSRLVEGAERADPHALHVLPRLP